MNYSHVLVKRSFGTRCNATLKYIAKTYGKRSGRREQETDGDDGRFVRSIVQSLKIAFNFSYLKLKFKFSIEFCVYYCMWRCWTKRRPYRKNRDTKRKMLTKTIKQNKKSFKRRGEQRTDIVKLRRRVFAWFCIVFYLSKLWK